MSKGNAEIELCYFCEIRDHSGLEKALSTEQHEQYEYRLPPTEDGQRRGRMRVRKTTKNGEVSYVQTIKTPANPESKLGDMEQDVDITEAFFNTWKSTFLCSGQHKIRYNFSANDVTLKVNGNAIKLPKIDLEVDIFLNQAGKRSKWGKIDVEVQDILKLLKESYTDITHAKFEIDFSDVLPLDIGQVVSAVTEDAEERAAIDNFFKLFEIKPE